MTNEAHFQERNMKHRRSIFHAVLYCLALIELLGPAAALAQHADLSAMDDVIDYVPKAKILGGKLAFQALLPVTNSSFTPSEVRFNPDGTGYVDTWVQRLTLEWDWSRANSWVAYALTAPTGRYAAGVANNIGSGYWSNSIASGTTVYLMKNNGITANLTTDWEIQRQEQGAKGTTGTLGRSFTMEWGVTQVLPLNKRMTMLLEFGVAGYDKWLVLNNGAPLPTGLSAGGMPVYSVHATGFQTNFIVPAKNVGFSFKYEPEYLAHAHARGRTIVFGSSWTW